MVQITRLSRTDLQVCIEGLHPVDLLGLALVRQCQPLPAGSWVPGNLPPDQVAQATLQFIEYANRCKVAAEHLSACSPVPVALSIVEFGL